MARLARVVAIDFPHHVTQRANALQFTLNADAEKMVYLVVIPHKPEALAFAFKQAHGRYASYWNASHRSSRHAWQGRFYSCPLDRTHLWEALRYTELNPVWAKLVSKPEEWPWSSAAAHCGIVQKVS